MLPTFIQQVVGAVIRAAIIWLAAWVAAHGGPSFTENQIAKVVAEATPVALVLLWSIYQKYRNRQKFMVAAAAGKSVSENHVDAIMASGQLPSVLTEPHVVPTLPNVVASSVTK